MNNERFGFGGTQDKGSCLVGKRMADVLPDSGEMRR
jgi:hypothetical protein